MVSNAIKETTEYIMRSFKMVLHTITVLVPEFEHNLTQASEKTANDYIASLIENHLSRTSWFHYASLFEIIEHPRDPRAAPIRETRHINDFYPKYGVETLRELLTEVKEVK